MLQESLMQSVQFKTNITDHQWWSQHCRHFQDMILHQIWHYADLHSRSPFRQADSAVLLDGHGCPLAMARIRIKKIPLAGVGVAEIDRGPLWIRCESKPRLNVLGMMLDSLKQEYCIKRNLELRMRPRSTMDPDIDAQLPDLFEKHGFHKNADVRPYHTIILDLDKSLDAIRSDFHQKWRNQLNVAERANLEVEYGTTVEHFDRFYAVYKAMWAKKKFPTGVRLPIIRRLQKHLPSDQQLLITIVRDGRQDIGATVCAPFGDTMVYFLGATMPNLRTDSRPGYLLQWLHIQKAKELGFRWYDLGGYDDNNQAIARFKKRTNGLQIIYPGQFEAWPANSPSKFFVYCEKAYRHTRRVLTGR